MPVNRDVVLMQAHSCAKIANTIISRERKVAEGAPDAESYVDEDRDRLLEVASQFIDLAHAYAAIAAAVPERPRPRPEATPRPTNTGAAHVAN